MRFHCLGIQHTVTSKDYVACAFTQKVLKFCSMMSRRGHTVIHYGHEDSHVECTEHVTVISREAYNEVYGTHDFHSKLFKFDQGDDVYKEFNKNAIREINVRKKHGDWLLAFWGSGHQDICQGAGQGMRVCEPGIGYPYGHFAEYKIFESYAMYHAYAGLSRVGNCVGLDMWSKEAVIPNYFDPGDFIEEVIPIDKRENYFLFVGRIGIAKGVDLAIRLTQALGVPLKIAGQNAENGLREVGMWPPPSHVELVGHIDAEQKKRLMAYAKAVVCMSMFAEPFCGVHVEAMMSGTPVVTADWGAFTEFNIHGLTGFRCRTLDHMIEAGRRIHEIDPNVCRKWAIDKFSTDQVANMYEIFFEGGQPKRIAIWSEKRWALGRIGNAIQKYLPHVDFYDWLSLEDNTQLWIHEKWRNYDAIISNTSLLHLNRTYGITVSQDLRKRLVVIAHCPRFDKSYFKEELTLMDDVKYGGVSQETCEEMKKYGVPNPVWTPFGADTDLFPLRHVVKSIRRIGFIGRNSHIAEAYQVKGIDMFRDICDRVGAEPVFIHDREPADMFTDIDLLVCCSEFEGGPLGIFEAASSGVPVLTRPVGNAQHIQGIKTFKTVDEAVECIQKWEDVDALRTYRDIVTEDVRKNWSMKTCIKKYLEPVLQHQQEEFVIGIGTAVNTRNGIFVEPIQNHLDEDISGCVKVRAAISDHDGKMNMYSIENPEKYNFPSWARGCNSLGKYHPTLLRLVHEKHLDEREVFTVDLVPVMTFSTLVKKYNIKNAQYLKIIAEGHDLKILTSYLECLSDKLIQPIKKIKFQTNSLIPTRDVDHMIQQLKQYDYQVIERGDMTTLEFVSIPWYYFYTPDYETWHRHLKTTLENSFDVKPLCFEKIEGLSDQHPVHHWVGCSTKVKLVIDTIKNNMGHRIVFSDVTWYVKNVHKLKKLVQDAPPGITFARNSNQDLINIGFMVIDCNPETLSLWETCLSTLGSEDHDQYRISCLVKNPQFFPHHEIVAQSPVDHETWSKYYESNFLMLKIFTPSAEPKIQRDAFRKTIMKMYGYMDQSDLIN